MLRNPCGVWARAAVMALLALSGGLIGTSVQAKTEAPAAVLQTMTVAALPPQGRDMMALIEKGGPFKYEKDGTVFGNREKILPARQRGYYREYTVRTPGESSRGARRIVCGGQQPRAPDACFYTDDHYGSFRQIAR
jgi:ribonuclease T1